MTISPEAPVDASFAESALAVIEDDGVRPFRDGRKSGHDRMIRVRGSVFVAVGVDGGESRDANTIRTECDRVALDSDPRRSEESGIDRIDSSLPQLPWRMIDTASNDSPTTLGVEVVSLHQKVLQGTWFGLRNRGAGGPVESALAITPSSCETVASGRARPLPLEGGQSVVQAPHHAAADHGESRLGVEREEPHPRDTAVTDVGSNVAFQKGPESGQGGDASEVAVPHLERDQADPGGPLVEIKLQLGRDQRPKDLGRHSPVGERDVRPGHDHRRGSRWKFG